MKHHSLSMELIALLCFSVSFPMSGATNQEGMPQIQSAPNPAVPVPTEAHRLALETAGGFARDGFRIRDAEWAIVLAKGMTTVLKVTLFAGNHYRFVVATATPLTIPEADLRQGLRLSSAVPILSVSSLLIPHPINRSSSPWYPFINNPHHVAIRHTSHTRNPHRGSGEALLHLPPEQSRGAAGSREIL